MRGGDLLKRLGVILQLIGGVSVVIGVWQWLGIAAALIIGGIIVALAGSLIEVLDGLGDDQQFDDDSESEGT